MCPDRKIISLHLDGELPSPWKEKMEAHLGACPECRATLAAYRRLGESICDLPDETLQAAQDRVWKKLTAPELIITEKSDHSQAVRAKKRIWKSTITLPLPAAAAAAAAIIIVFIALLGIRSEPRSLPQDSMAALPGNLQVILDDHQDIVPVQDMTGVLQYLSNQDNEDYMVIRLPEHRRFSRTGEPALINAANYSRRNTFR